MKTRKRITKIVSVLFIGVLFMSCTKEELVQEESEELTSVAHKWRKKKIRICHTGRYGHCRIIKIPKWAWKWHKRHGDVRLDDKDGDGYVPDNPCGYGEMGDCDDNDPLVNPGIVGSCGDETDSDGDGVPDVDDACPDEVGLESLAGCPDADGDGVSDKEDSCPNEAGPSDNDGCPFADTDGDGVLDEDDECPNVAGTVENNGCPQIGLSDYEILKLLYEANPDNRLGWDLSNSSMDDWEGVSLNSEGNVSSLRLLFGTNVQVLPPEVGGMRNLLELFCACDILEELPPEIGQLEKLISLGLVGTKITKLPNQITRLSNLRALAVFDNILLTKLPEGLGSISNLEALNIHGNALIEIPSELANLTRLIFLDLSENPVTEIPQAVCDLADAGIEVKLDSNDVCK